MFQPETGDASQGIDRIATMIETHFFDNGSAIRIRKLLRLQLVVIFPRLFEVFSESAISDSHPRAGGKGFFVRNGFTGTHMH